MSALHSPAQCYPRMQYVNCPAEEQYGYWLFHVITTVPPPLVLIGYIFLEFKAKKRNSVQNYARLGMIWAAFWNLLHNISQLRAEPLMTWYFSEISWHLYISGMWFMLCTLARFWIVISMKLAGDSAKKELSSTLSFKLFFIYLNIVTPVIIAGVLICAIITCIAPQHADPLFQTGQYLWSIAAGSVTILFIFGGTSIERHLENSLKSMRSNVLNRRKYRILYYKFKIIYWVFTVAGVPYAAIFQIDAYFVNVTKWFVVYSFLHFALLLMCFSYLPILYTNGVDDSEQTTDNHSGGAPTTSNL